MMFDYRIQFTPEDIVNTLERMKAEAGNDPERRKDVASALRHRLLSPISPIGLLEMIIKQRNENPAVERYIQEFYIDDLLARAYVCNILQILKNCRDSIEKLSAAGLGCKEATPPDMLEMSQEYHGSLIMLSQYVPMSDTVKRLAVLNAKQKEICGITDNKIFCLIYENNLLFSPSFQKSQYQIRCEIAEFCRRARETLSHDKIFLIPANKIGNIFMHDDYVAECIAPLVWNARDHAFNPENDIHNRSNDAEFSKYAFIYGNPELIDDPHPNYKERKRVKNEGYYTVRVEDNGFGIRAEHLPHIFEKGFTTKTGQPGDHGIGLWAVKRFIEKRGGRISVETELGQGTTFRFTIPYTLADGVVCVQAQMQ